MFLGDFLRHLTRAVLVAVPVTAVYGCRKKRRRWMSATVFYMTVLFSATVTRDGRHLLDFWKIPHTMQSVQTVPFLVTLQQGKAGAWYLFYPVAGNILWFLPFGFLLKKRSPHTGFWGAVGGSFLLSLGIELLQWVLLSGISDIDDVIFNVLGGALGWRLGAKGSCKDIDK